MQSHRVKDLGWLARACTMCGATGTLRLREVQDLRRWGPLRLRSREPYWLARCSQCTTTIPVRRTSTRPAAPQRVRWAMALIVVGNVTVICLGLAVVAG